MSDQASVVWCFIIVCFLFCFLIGSCTYSSMHTTEFKEKMLKAGYQEVKYTRPTEFITDTRWEKVLENETSHD